MNKIDRLAFIKERAKAKPKLTEAAAKFIEILKNEDTDLGENNAFGECLIANVDDIEEFNPNHSGLDAHDEQERNVVLISPLMYKATEKIPQRVLNRRETF